MDEATAFGLDGGPAHNFRFNGPFVAIFIDDFEYDRDYQADKLEEIWTVLAISGIATERGKVKCYCGETMVEEEFIDGKWIAIQFCSQECKDKDTAERCA